MAGCTKMELSIHVVDDASELTGNAALARAINELGERSAVAQNLNRPITLTELFTKHAIAQRQSLYLALKDDIMIGFLKTGCKHLFYVDTKGIYKELDPICVLDFYVHEDYQRHGVGLELFARMLEREGVSANKLAYDRPSPKLMAFLSKHCSLTGFTPQPNNFVVFDDYFDAVTRQPADKERRLQATE